MGSIQQFLSPVGGIRLTESAGAITSLSFIESSNTLVAGSALLDEAQRQIMAYFSGQLQVFDLPFVSSGTVFQERVWATVRQIPYGHTYSYKEIAMLIGQPKAARAVGRAINQNPILLVTPCHRVVGSNQELVGYSAGLATKSQLLHLEKITLQQKGS